MKKMLITLSTLSALLSFSSAFALSLDSAPVVSSGTETSFSIDWEDVDGALGYYIYYSKDSGTVDGYDFEWVDLIESSETTLENLEKDTQYYMAVTVVDENGNESQFSPETSFTTWTESSTEEKTTTPLAIKSAVVLSANQIELEFNLPLDNTQDAVRELKIVEKQSWSEAFVSDSILSSDNPMKLMVRVDTDFVEGSEYDLTVVSIQDTNKNNIESGIDGITTFTVPRWSTTSYQETKNAPTETVDLEVEVPELNAAGTATWSEQKILKWGKQLSDEELTKTAELAAKDNEALPQTGPETVLLLLLAIMLGGGLFFLHSRKA